MPTPGERLVVTGECPEARYFSFHVHDEKLVALDSIYDAQIDPDSGSSNPFRAKRRHGSGDRHTVCIDFEPAPAEPAPDERRAPRAGMVGG